VLVVGNRNDPATRYQDAVSTSRLLGRARLLTVAGWGHTSLFLSSCADAYVSRYLLTGRVSPKGTVCRSTRCRSPSRRPRSRAPGPRPTPTCCRPPSPRPSNDSCGRDLGDVDGVSVAVGFGHPAATAWRPQPSKEGDPA
jgi:TAP-like protein